MHMNRQSEFISLGVIKRTIVAFALMFLEFSGAAHADDKKRVALVIGNSDYKHV